MFALVGMSCSGSGTWSRSSNKLAAGASAPLCVRGAGGLLRRRPHLMVPRGGGTGGPDRARKALARSARAGVRAAGADGPRAGRAQAGAGARVELTCLAWNRKVQHILATGRLDGAVVVYDLKKQRPIIELKDKAGRAPGAAALRPPRLPAAFCVVGNISGPGLSRFGVISLPGCGVAWCGLQTGRRHAVAWLVASLPVRRQHLMCTLWLSQGVATQMRSRPKQTRAERWGCRAAA